MLDELFQDVDNELRVARVRVHAASNITFDNESKCTHCTAAYGHTILCPSINRNVAEAISASKGVLTPDDVIRASGLGIIW